MGWSPHAPAPRPESRRIPEGCICRACQRAVRCDRARRDAEGRYTCPRCQAKER